MKQKIFYAAILFFAAFCTSLAQDVIITGVVTDDADEPLFGAVVMVKDTKTGVTTDFDGSYNIKAPIGSTLVFSYIGMKTQERKVTANSRVIGVKLEIDAQEVEEVVVMGYGSAKKISSTTGSVAQVKMKDLAEAPTANVMDALQGKVAGLNISSSSGEPGGKSVIKLHGEASIESAFLEGDTEVGQPLFILDGIPVDSGVVNSMNPADFETVTVMKDASATSIYGARAANGVIYITTKKGRKGETSTVTINTQVGFSNLYSRKFYNKLMNTQEYIDFWTERDNGTGIYTADLDQIKQNFPYDTRWDEFYFKKNVPTYQSTVSVAGGSDKTSYFISGGYLKQEGILYRSNYERYTLRASIDSQVNNWLQVGLSLSTGTNENSTSITANVNEAPFLSFFDENGKEVDYFVGPTNLVINPKYMADKMPSVTNSQDIIPTGYVSITPFENFILKSQAGVQYSVSEGEVKILPSYLENLDPTFAALAPTPSTRRDINKFIYKTLTNTAEYQFDIKEKNNFTILVGQEMLHQESSGFDASSSGQVQDALTMLEHGKVNRDVGDHKTITTFNSFFSRLDYNYDNKYFIDLSARRDGSSSFGRNNRYANFWAVGLLWNLKRENFLKNVDWLDDLRLKFSSGISGNVSTSAYAHLTLIGTEYQYKNKLGYSIHELGNPDLQWEKQQKTNLGISLGLFNRVNLEVDLYNRITRDMVLTQDILSIFGFNQVSVNAAKMQNKGIDVNLTVTAYKDSENNAYIRPYVMFGYNQQKVLKLTSDYEKTVISAMTGKGKTLLVEGEPLLYGMPIFHRVNPDTGAPEWYLPGDDRTTTQTDASQITNDYNEEKLAQNTGKKRQAPLSGGFGLNASYRAFSFQVGFSFLYGHYMINQDIESLVSAYGVTPLYSKNLGKEANNYWKNPGDNTPYPSADYPAFMGTDTRMLEDASFIRLKNISLSYTLPQEIVEQIGFFKGIRFYTTGRNLLTFTNYSGADPEFNASALGGGYPSTKEYAFGIEVKF